MGCAVKLNSGEKTGVDKHISNYHDPAEPEEFIPCACRDEDPDPFQDYSWLSEKKNQCIAT
jgi:hypothetical protein